MCLMNGKKEIAKEQLYSGEHLFCLHGYLCDDVVEQAKTTNGRVWNCFSSDRSRIGN